MAGLTPTGLDIETLQTIIAAFVADQIANIDADINTEADSLLGQLNAIYGAALDVLWELLEEVYQSGFADTASGQSLAYVAAITGTIKAEATKATLDVQIQGTVSTPVPVGFEVYVDGDPGSRFVTTAPATIAEEGATDFINVTMTAVTAGTSTRAFTTDSLVIATPVSGIDAVVVLVDYVEGADEETDSALRVRRILELARPGTGTVDAIRTDILDVEGVDFCNVFHNPTGTTDVNGLPPKSVEVVIDSFNAPLPTDQDIADALLASVPAGTLTVGPLNETAIDDSGTEQTMNWSEPTDIRTYVEVELTYNALEYVGDATVETAIAVWSNDLELGQDVFASDIVNVVKDLAGVVNVVFSGTSVDDETPTVSTDLVIGPREVSTIAVLDITVTSTEAV